MHIHMYTYTDIEENVYALTICISAVCDGGLGGSGDNSQVGGLMLLSSDATTECLCFTFCFTGNGGGSS